MGGFPAILSGTPYTDSDHDGMPVAWENKKGFNRNNSADRNNDPDSDGYTNIEEFLNATNPLSAETTTINESASVPAVYLYEVENLTTTASKGDSYYTNSHSRASNSQWNYFNADTVNDYIEFTVNVPSAGTYYVKTGTRDYRTRGVFQLSVDGCKLGSTVDQYSCRAKYNEYDLGNITFDEKGNKLFRFTVTGKNKYSNGYIVGIDYIKLFKYP